MSSLRRRPGAGVAGLSWGLLDQGFSSATNLGLSVLAGRAAGPRGLGVVAIGFAAYLICLTMQRALLTDPLVVMSARLPGDDRVHASRQALTVAISGAIGASLAILGIGLVLPPPYGHGLILFVPWLGGALLQDFWRAVLFRDGRGGAAALNDGIWALVMVAAIPLLLISADPWIVVLTWGAGAVTGALLGFWQSGLRPVLTTGAYRWWRENISPLARWLAAEATLLLVQGQFAVFALAFILTPADVGGLRSVQAVFAPMTLLNQALAFPGLPMLTRAVARGTRPARRLALRLSCLASGLVLAYLLVVALFPHHLLGVLFGPAFDRYDSLIAPVAVLQLLGAGALGFSLLLRAAGRGRVLVVSRTIGAGATAVLIPTLAVTAGLTAAVWGLTIGAGSGMVSNVLRATLPARKRR